MNLTPEIIKSPQWDKPAAKPVLSILVPYYKFDCRQLISELLAQAETLDQPVELLLADDGSQDKALNHSLGETLSSSQIETHWQIYSDNTGRSSIRNALLKHARADFVLFLDCDMLPDSDHFIQNYLVALDQYSDALAIVGGRSYQRIPKCERDQSLYKYFSNKTECISADKRQENASWYVFTNNIVVNREISSQVEFDESYIGWGFEDTDWGIRVARLGKVLHIDNPATHLGLISDQALLKKYRESLPNFLRMLSRHPDEMLAMPITRWASKIATSKALAMSLRKLTEVTVFQRWLPVKIRYSALQLHRACIYACELANSP